MGTIVIQAPNHTLVRRVATEAPTLEAMQGLLDGYVELIWRGQTVDDEPAQFFVNEEGLIRELPFNPQANILFRQLFGHDYPQLLAGPAVALVGADVQWT